METDVKRRLATTLVNSTTLALSLLAAPVSVGTIGILAPSVASAQDYTSANLTGVVRNEAGAPVAGAKVVVTSDQGLKRSTVAGQDGAFNVTALSFGDYKANVTASGYAVLALPVTVSPSGSSYDLVLVKPSEAADVVVTARRSTKTADFNRTDVGLAVDVPALTAQIPVARDVASVALLTPGAGVPDASVATGVRRANQSIITLAGTSAAENAYYLNGLNVTDQRTFLGFASVPFDAIASIDVKTDGYQAEYGRATGGVLSITTKSGSNDLHFGSSVFYSPDGLRDRDPVAYGVGPGTGGTTYNNTARQSDLESDVYIGLPLLKDHLFFFGVYDADVSKTSFSATGNGAPGTVAAQTGNQAFESSSTPSWLFKIDAVITDKQKIEWTEFSDVNTNHNTSCVYSTATGCVSPGLPVANHSGGLDNIVKYTGVMTDWFTLSALWGHVNSNYTDSGLAIGTPLVRDSRTGATLYLTNNLNAGPYNQADADSRDTYRVDGDFYFHLFGPHHVRIGYDEEKLTSTDLSAYSGSGSYWDIQNTSITPIPGDSYSGDYISQTYRAQGGTFHATQDAAYIEDSWQPVRTLTIQVGIRNDIYDYRTSDDKSFINLKNQFAPRLGVTWDPFDGGNDKAYASYGRFYLPIAENTAILEAAAAPFMRYYYATGVATGAKVAQNAAGAPLPGALFTADTQIFATATAPDPRTVAAANITPMYSEDFVIGYDHIFRSGPLSSWKAGVKYIHRDLANTIEDTDLQETATSGALSNYCARLAVATCNAAAYTGAYTLFNPGQPAKVFVDIDGTGGKYITLSKADLQMPKATNTYDAVTLTLEKPFDGVWGVSASYVWSRSYGNYEGAVSSDTGSTLTSITQAFDTPYEEYHATGYLPNDHTHTFKIYGSYAPPALPGLTIGVNQTLQSGRPYGCLGYDAADPSPNPSPSEWYCAPASGGTDAASPRGSRGRTDWVWDTDLKFSYRIPTPGVNAGALSVEADVFNLFANDAETRVQEQGDVSGAPGVPLSTYGQPRSYQDPRYVRFGIRYAY